jgi:hypothetical protein
MLDLAYLKSNNNFSFNGKHYLQVEGTAIGSRLGMNYASTYLGVWEQQLLEQSSDKRPMLVYMHLSLLFWGRLDIHPLHPCRIKLNPPEVFALLNSFCL